MRLHQKSKDIKEAIAREDSAVEKRTGASLFSDKYRYLVIAGVGIAALQQFQGANAIFYYIPLIVQKATGIAASSSLLWPIIQGIILVSGSFVCIIIADKCKRRTLLMLGGVVMGSSFLLPIVIKNVIPNSSSMIIIGFLCIYVAFYSFTWAPLIWVLIGKIFPLSIRGSASGIASSVNWIGSWIVGLLFPIMTAKMPQEVVFAIFGAIYIIGVVFVKFFVPETKGYTLEQIEAETIK